MSATLIGWIITLLVLFILVYSVLMGVKRGLGKSLFRLIWLLVFAVILFFVTPPIANALNTIDISMLNIDIYGEVRTIGDIGLNLVNALAETNEVFANSETLISIATALPAMIISIPLYVLLFFVTKWLLWPIWAIISSQIFDKQKRAQKKFKKEQKMLAKQNGSEQVETPEMPIELTVKKKKNRLGGAVIGLVIGLVISIVTFMPFIGINGIYQNIANIKVTNEDGTQVSLIENQINDPNVTEYLSLFENSVASKMLTYTGVGFVSNAMFGYLTTTSVDNQKISLSSEVSTLAKAYDNINTLMNIGEGELTKQKLDKSLTAAKELLNKVKESTLVNVLGDDILPLLINNYIEQEDLYIVDGGDIDALIVSSYKSYAKKFNTQDLENQLENLVDVLVALNNSNLIIPIANGTVNTLDGILNLVGENVTTPNNFTNTIVNKIYEISLFSNKYPELLESAVESIFKAIDDPDLQYSNNIIEREPLKESLRTILSNFISFARCYSKAENMDFGNDTMEAFKSLGNTIDTLKTNILGENNYTSLLNYAIKNINDAVNNALGDYPASEKKTESERLVKDLLNSLADITKWGGEDGELYAINTLYSKVIKVVNSELTEEKFLDPNFTAIEEIGEGVTSAMRGNSKIVTNANIRRILEVLINKVDDGEGTLSEVLNIQVYDQNSTTIKKSLKDNILDNIYIFTNSNSGNISATGWTNEFKYNVAIIKKAYKVITGEITSEELTSSNNKVLQQIGASLDKTFEAKANLIFTPSTMRGIIEYFLDNKISLPEEAQKIMDYDYLEGGVRKGNVKAQILNNIYNPEMKTSNVVTVSHSYWEEEFIKIKNLLGEDFETTELADLGRLLDGVLGSRIFTRNVINSVVIKNIDDAVTNNELNYLNNEGGIDAMKANLENVESYKKEFGYLKQLIDVMEATKEDSTKVKLRRIGETFDTITNVGVNEALGSKMLTTSVVNLFVTYYFNDYINTSLVGDENAKLREVVNSMLDNLGHINDYSKELENIVNVADVLKDKTKTLTEIGTVLDADNVRTSKLINTTVIRKLVNYFIDDKTKTIDIGLQETITLLKLNVENENILIDASNSSTHGYAQEFTYLNTLTETITKSGATYGEIGASLDSVRRPTTGKASRFISQGVVDSFITYYFEKFEEEANFDADLDADLISVVNNIKGNISKIVSYEKELTNLEALFNIVDLETNKQKGAELDKINGKSTLITREDINNIVLSYFNKQANTYEETYGSVISSMRAKLIKLKESTTAKYEICFDDLSTIITSFNDFNSVTSLDDFDNNTSTLLGKKLDQIEKLKIDEETGNTKETIIDEKITKDMANIVINKLKGFVNALADETLKVNLTTAINITLNGDGTNNEFDFANYTTDEYTGSYTGETYYQSLFNDLSTAITNAKNG